MNLSLVITQSNQELKLAGVDQGQKQGHRIQGEVMAATQR